MKHRISISVEETTIEHIRSLVRSGVFRNKSHAVEEAIVHYYHGKKNN